ncbi:hypothetical protein D3C71_955770 [compost metagenome]
MLHGGQRVDVLDAPGIELEAVHLALRQLRERNVRRREAAGLVRHAVRDQAFERRLVALCNRLHLGRAMQVLAVVPVGDQAVVLDLGDHLEPCAARAAGGARSALGLACQAPCARIAPVQLAEVVEGEVRLRCFQALLAAAQIPQDTIAQAVRGYGPQRLLGAQNGLPRIRARREPHRIQRGEPADGPAQVHVLEQILAPVGFEFYAHAVLARPGAQAVRQRGQQQLVRASAVGLARLLEQLRSLRRADHDLHAARRARRVVAARTARRPRCIGTARCLPVGQLAAAGLAGAVGGKAH